MWFLINKKRLKTNSVCLWSLRINYDHFRIVFFFLNGRFRTFTENLHCWLATLKGLITAEGWNCPYYEDDPCLNFTKSRNFHLKPYSRAKHHFFPIRCVFVTEKNTLFLFFVIFYRFHLFILARKWCAATAVGSGCWFNSLISTLKSGNGGL